MQTQMNRLLSKCGPWILTLVFGIAVLLFWWKRYPFALSYQEQFQLFLFDTDYFLHRLSEPGGIARYVSEFLVQFYNNVLLGASVIALLLMVLQRVMWRLMKAALVWYPLSFIPSLLAWYMMGDESLLLAFPVAVVMVSLFMLLYNALSRFPVLVRVLIALLLIPVAYWITGPVVLSLALYIGGRELQYSVRGGSQIKHGFKLSGVGLALGLVVYSLFCIVISKYLVPYTTSQLFCGIGYHRYFEFFLVMMAVMMLLIALLPLVARPLPDIVKPRSVATVIAIQLLTIIVVIVSLIPSNFDSRTYELIEYDYLVRLRQWDRIISKATEKTPDLPMSVCATNMALAMKGELGNRAFDFYQRSSDGLFPPFERNFSTVLTTGEVYFNLGLVNTAQRFAFEAMEALPNYNKSARCLRRLAETNLINGQYEVARKYLLILEKTLFYKKWAQSMMEMLGDEKQINAHPLYGYLRKVRLQEDFLFSEQEVDKICGQLVMKSKENVVAVQYLLLYPLLNRDINTFMNYMSFVSQRMSYTSRICQEAIVFAYASRSQTPPQGMVIPAVLQSFNGFMRAYQSNGPLLAYKNTLWYYLMKGQ